MWGGGSKMKILAFSTKLNQISYTYSVDLQKAENIKINHPKCGAGSKMKILALSAKLNQISDTYSVGPQKARNAKTKHPKFGGGSKNENLGPCTKHLP